MTPITEIVIPLTGIAGIVAMVWGAATLVRAHKAADDVNKDKIDRHDDECKAERKANAAAISQISDRVLILETMQKGRKTK